MCDVFTLDCLHVCQARSDAIFLLEQWAYISLKTMTVIKRSVAFCVTLYYERVDLFTTIPIDSSTKRMNNRWRVWVQILVRGWWHLIFHALNHECARRRSTTKTVKDIMIKVSIVFLMQWTDASIIMLLLFHYIRAIIEIFTVRGQPWSDYTGSRGLLLLLLL